MTVIYHYKINKMSAHAIVQQRAIADETEETYSLEQDLVDRFLSFLCSDSTPWGKLRVKTEFSYLRGRADIIALTEAGEVIAFEAKLSKWRDATHQAYRNTCFANQSYVILPAAAAKNAHAHEHEFDRRGVGLCSIKDDSIDVVKSAKHHQPIQEWLFQHASDVLRR